MFLFTPSEIKTLEAERPFVYRGQVRFQDVDAAGIVFYTRIQEYFHDAYVAFLADSGFELPQVLEEASFLAPIRHAEADYLRPVRFGVRYDVKLVQGHTNESEATIAYRFESQAGLHAFGQTVHAFVDPKSFKRCPMPEALGARIRDLGKR